MSDSRDGRNSAAISVADRDELLLEVQKKGREVHIEEWASMNARETTETPLRPQCVYTSRRV